MGWGGGGGWRRSISEGEKSVVSGGEGVRGGGGYLFSLLLLRLLVEVIPVHLLS